MQLHLGLFSAVIGLVLVTTANNAFKEVHRNIIVVEERENMHVKASKGYNVFRVFNTIVMILVKTFSLPSISSWLLSHSAVTLQ